MSLNIITTKWKCILSGNRVLRLSVSVEEIYYIFLEQMDEQDLLKRRTLMYTSKGQWLLDGETWMQDTSDEEKIAKIRFDELKEAL